MSLLGGFPGFVYLLCTGTSFLCAGLLLRGYRRDRARLLLWSSLCFFGLALENGLLYIDRIIVPDLDLAVLRRLPGLIAMVLLLIGLVFDSE
jgi:hypothetical protein